MRPAHRLYVANRESNDRDGHRHDDDDDPGECVVWNGAFRFGPLSPDGLHLYVVNVQSNDLAVIEDPRRCNASL